MLRKKPRRRELTPEQAVDAAAAGAAAVVLLARRDFCSAELRHKLEAQGFEAATVQAIVREFIERGYLNDERYGRQFVAYHAERGHGPLRIERELAQRGLDAALIDRRRWRKRRTGRSGPRAAHPPIRAQDPRALAGEGKTSPVFAIPRLFQRSYPFGFRI